MTYTSQATDLYNLIQEDNHTQAQADLIRREIGVYAEDATIEQLEQIIENAIEGGFVAEQEILGI